ncbi:MAG: hypothetical protein RI907_3389 [Pseudomonadota bacterium]|jgi:hypothetical protein
MFIELLLIALVAGGGWWLLHSGRRRLMHAARRQVSQARWLDAQGNLVFDGAQAAVVSEDLSPMGSDVTGPYVVGRYVCAMPSGQRFVVTVQTAHHQAPAHTEVSAEGPLTTRGSPT